MKETNAYVEYTHLPSCWIQKGEQASQLQGQNLHGIEQDGWCIGPNLEHLLWIPEDCRDGLYFHGMRRVIGNGKKKELIFDRFVHGDHWTECYQSSTGKYEYES